MTIPLKLLSALCAATLAAACSGKILKPPPSVEGAQAPGALKSITIDVTYAASGERGTISDGITLNIGETAYLSAQGRDAANRPIKINPSWRISKPELAELSPEFGDMVGLKGLREGSAEILVEYQGIKLVLRHISIQ